MIIQWQGKAVTMQWQGKVQADLEHSVHRDSKVPCKTLVASVHRQVLARLQQQCDREQLYHVEPGMNIQGLDASAAAGGSDTRPHRVHDRVHTWFRPVTKASAAWPLK